MTRTASQQAQTINNQQQDRGTSSDTLEWQFVLRKFDIHLVGE